jgi:malate dehydrogenase
MENRLNVVAKHLIQSKPEDKVEPNKVACCNCNSNSNAPVRVLITGAAGNIGYAVSFSVAEGLVYGPNQPVILHLLEIEQAKKAVLGIEMELSDGAYPLVAGLVATTDPAQAFTGVDAIIMVGAFPRQKGMERKDLLEKNCSIFKNQGLLIEKYASKSVKVLVVGNPANTNCLIASMFAPSIPLKQWSALTRLDQNRAMSEIASRAKVSVGDVKNVVIWGNHSTTQFPDCSTAFISRNGKKHPVHEVLDKNYLTKEFIGTIQNRGGAVIAQRGTSSSQSAARAIIGHMRDWVQGTKPGEYVSMAVVSDGSYNVPKGLVFSFPVTIQNGDYQIVKGLALNEFALEKMRITTEELEQEKATVLSFVNK